jgi:hypothetical protein
VRFVTHSTEQTLYFDDKGLIRRHDYSVDISNGAQAAHYLYDHQEFGGFIFPTRRRINPRAGDLKPLKDLVAFSAELDDLSFTARLPRQSEINTDCGAGFRPSPTYSPIRYGLVFPRFCLFIRIVHGAKDNISPRSRVEYYPGYYAADVFDPDGYSFEVVQKS